MLLSHRMPSGVPRTVFLVILTGVFGLAALPATAQPPGSTAEVPAQADASGPMRTWTDSTGAYTVEAAFVKLRAGMVTLHRKDGRTIELPLEKLSKADRDWLWRQAQRPGGVGAPVTPEVGASSDPAAVGSAAAGKSGTFTMRELRAAYLVLFRRLYREEYLRVGKKDPAWDAAALRLLDAAVEFGAKRYSESWQTFPAPTRDEMRQLSAAALAAGCDDPLVFLVHASTLEPSEWNESTSKTGFQMLATIQGQGYSSLHVALLARTLYQHGRNPRSARVEVLEGKEYADALERHGAGKQPTLTILLKHIVETICDPSLSPTERRFVLPTLRSMVSASPNLSEPLQELLAARTDADPWLVAMLLGRMEADRGWKVSHPDVLERMDKVVPQDATPYWRRARDHFTKAWKLQPQCPEAAEQMMRLVLDGGGQREDTIRIWFDRAVSAQIDWEPAYINMRQDFAKRGDVNGIYAFGTECLRTGRYDTSIPFWFLLILDDIRGITRSYAFYKRPDVYRNVREFFRGNATVTDDKNMDLFASLEALYACLADQHADARGAFERVGSRLDRDLFKRHNLDPDMEFARALVGTSPLRPEIEAMEKTAAAGQSAQAATACRALLAKLGASDPARAYLRHRAAALELEAKFAGGDWVPLAMTPDLAGWTPISGEWSVDSSGALVGKSVVNNVKDRRGAMLLTMARIGNRFEIEGHAELLSERGGYGAVTSHRGMDSYWECLFYLPEVGNRGEVYVMCAAHRNPHPRPAKVERAADFRIQVYDGRVATMVGSELERDFVPFVVLLDHDHPTDATPFGIACSRGMLDDPPVAARFTKLKVRKMTAPPRQAAAPEPE